MGRGFAFDTTPNSVEAFVEQNTQAPTGAISGQAIQIVDVDVAVSMRIPFFFGVHLVQPVVGNDFSGHVVDQTGIGIRGVGIGIDAPIGLLDILGNGLGTVHISGVFV